MEASQDLLFQTFPDANSFLRQAQPFLEQHESANNLMFGVSLRLRAYPDWIDEQPFMALMRGKDEQIALAAVLTPPNRLMLVGNPNLATAKMQAAIADFIHQVRGEHWPIPGVIGENRFASSFAQEWINQTGQNYEVKVRLRNYELRQVSAPQSRSPGQLRLAEQKDIETAARWHFEFSREATHQGDPEASYHLVSQRLQNQDVFFWEDGEPVSMAFRARPTTHGITVSAVYTPPQQRNHGYASACVAALSQHLLDAGSEFCNLFTDLDYPTSNAIYQKIGYRPVCDYTDYVFQLI